MGKDHADINRHVRVYLMVFGALLVLTAATVGAWKLQFLTAGSAIALALAIALCKAGLVALYFMHLRYDRPFNAIVFVASLLFVMLFVSLALMDTVHYQYEIIPGPAPGLEQ